MTKEIPNLPRAGQERQYARSGELYRMIGEQRLTIHHGGSVIAVHLGGKVVGMVASHHVRSRWPTLVDASRTGARITAPAPAKWFLVESGAVGWWNEVKA